MNSFAGQVLLESVVVPAVVSALIVLPTRRLSRRVFVVFVYAAAFLAAIVAAYVMVFGWPIMQAQGARQKIVLLTSAGLLIGIGLSLGKTHFLRSVLLIPSLTILVAGPLWIGWPALMQGQSDAILLALPLMIAPVIVATWIDDRSTPSTGEELDRCKLLIVTAIGLALIALFAQTLSIMQLSLALASTLAVVSLTGRKLPEPILTMAGATMLSGFLTALLLYSEASLTAIMTLSCIFVLPLAQRLLSSFLRTCSRPWPVYLTAVILSIASVSIARIDAGSISVY